MNHIRDKVAFQTFRYAKELRHRLTPAESRLWHQLRLKKLNGMRFRCQAVILGWIADFYCPGSKLVVEVDGSSHKFKKQSDDRRDFVMKRKGLHTIRFSNFQVFNDLQGVLQKIRSYGEGNLAP